MRSDHLSKHIKTHQKGSRLNPATSSTDPTNGSATIASSDLDQSDLLEGGGALQIGLDEMEDDDDDMVDDSDDESGSDISDSEIAPTNVAPSSSLAAPTYSLPPTSNPHLSTTLMLGTSGQQKI